MRKTKKILFQQVHSSEKGGALLMVTIMGMVMIAGLTFYITQTSHFERAAYRAQVTTHDSLIRGMLAWADTSLREQRCINPVNGLTKEGCEYWKDEHFLGRVVIPESAAGQIPSSLFDGETPLLDSMSFRFEIDTEFGQGNSNSLSEDHPLFIMLTSDPSLKTESIEFTFERQNQHRDFFLGHTVVKITAKITGRSLFNSIEEGEEEQKVVVGGETTQIYYPRMVGDYSLVLNRNLILGDLNVDDPCSWYGFLHEEGQDNNCRIPKKANIFPSATAGANVQGMHFFSPVAVNGATYLPKDRPSNPLPVIFEGGLESSFIYQGPSGNNHWGEFVPQRGRLLMAQYDPFTGVTGGLRTFPYSDSLENIFAKNTYPNNVQTSEDSSTNEDSAEAPATSSPTVGQLCRQMERIIYAFEGLESADFLVRLQNDDDLGDNRFRLEIGLDRFNQFKQTGIRMAPNDWPRHHAFCKRADVYRRFDFLTGERLLSGNQSLFGTESIIRESSDPIWPPHPDKILKDGFTYDRVEWQKHLAGERPSMDGIFTNYEVLGASVSSSEAHRVSEYNLNHMHWGLLNYRVDMNFDLSRPEYNSWDEDNMCTFHPSDGGGLDLDFDHDFLQTDNTASMLIMIEPRVKGLINRNIDGVYLSRSLSESDRTVSRIDFNSPESCLRLTDSGTDGIRNFPRTHPVVLSEESPYGSLLLTHTSGPNREEIDAYILENIENPNRDVLITDLKWRSVMLPTGRFIELPLDKMIRLSAHSFERFKELYDEFKNSCSTELQWRGYNCSLFSELSNQTFNIVEQVWRNEVGDRPVPRLRVSLESVPNPIEPGSSNRHRRILDIEVTGDLSRIKTDSSVAYWEWAILDADRVFERKIINEDYKNIFGQNCYYREIDNAGKDSLFYLWMIPFDLTISEQDYKLQPGGFRKGLNHTRIRSGGYSPNSPSTGLQFFWQDGKVQIRELNQFDRLDVELTYDGIENLDARKWFSLSLLNRFADPYRAEFREPMFHNGSLIFGRQHPDLTETLFAPELPAAPHGVDLTKMNYLERSTLSDTPWSDEENMKPGHPFYPGYAHWEALCSAQGGGGGTPTVSETKLEFMGREGFNSWNFNPISFDTQFGSNQSNLNWDNLYNSPSSSYGNALIIHENNQHFFHTYGILDYCEVTPDAQQVIGLLVCRRLVILPRSEPLKMIGTFVVDQIEIDPSAINTGVQWMSLLHPVAHGTLTHEENNILRTDCRSRPDRPIWSLAGVDPNSSEFADQYQRFRGCSPAGLMELADPFRWPSFTPQCWYEYGRTHCFPRGVMGRYHGFQLSTRSVLNE